MNIKKLVWLILSAVVVSLIVAHYVIKEIDFSRMADDAINQINQVVDDYKIAHGNYLIYACTQEMAEDRDIRLSKNFYEAKQRYKFINDQALEDLKTTMKNLKDRFEPKTDQSLDKLAYTADIIDKNDKDAYGVCKSHPEIAKVVSDNLSHYSVNNTK